jgi:hypothetical protein
MAEPKTNWEITKLLLANGNPTGCVANLMLIGYTRIYGDEECRSNSPVKSKIKSDELRNYIAREDPGDPPNPICLECVAALGLTKK